MGVGAVTLSDQADGRAEVARTAVAASIPDADVTLIRGVRESSDDGGGAFWSLRKPGSDGMLVQSYGSTLGSPVLVADGDVRGIAGIPVADRARAERRLADGGVVAFTERPVDANEVTVVVEQLLDPRARPPVVRDCGCPRRTSGLTAWAPGPWR